MLVLELIFHEIAIFNCTLELTKIFVDFSVYIGAFSKTKTVDILGRSRKTLTEISGKVFLLRPAINLPWPGVIYIWGHKIGSVVSTFMGYKQTNIQTYKHRCRASPIISDYHQALKPKYAHNTRKKLVFSKCKFLT